MIDPLYLLRICWKGQLNSQEHNYEFRSFYFQFLSEQFQLRAVTNSFEFKIFWHGLLILCNPIYPGAELVSTKSQTLSWNPCITLLHCIDLHFCQALKWPDSRCWPFYCNIGWFLQPFLWFIYCNTQSYAGIMTLSFGGSAREEKLGA